MLEKQYSDDFLKGLITAAEAILLLRDRGLENNELRKYMYENKALQIMSIMQKLTEHQIKVLSLKELYEKVVLAT